MRTLVLVAVLSTALSACGTTVGDRGLSGAAIGAGIGIIGGPPGMVVGGAIGAAAGALTPSRNVNLGKPVWHHGDVAAAKPETSPGAPAASSKVEVQPLQ